MTAPWLVAAGLTLAGSAHCAGMCGGFVLAAGAGRPGRLRLVSHQLQLQLGKATSYAFLGALAGGLGAALLASPLVAWAGRALAVLAALALALAGASLLGMRGAGERAASSWLGRAAARVAQPLFAARPPGFALVMGMLMGVLPCPLVYAGLAAAAAAGTPAAGAAIMAGVALGTLPALALVALFGSALSLVARQRLARVAGVVLLAAAVLTLARAAGVHAGHAGHAAAPSALEPGARPAETPPRHHH